MFGCGASPAGRGGLRFKFGGLQVKLGTFLTIVVLAVAGGQVSAPRAQGVAPANAANLNISPKRITFDRSHRSGTVFIFNQGTGPGTFDISLVDRVMLPNGRIISVEEAQADPETKAVADRVKSAQSLLQISPRRVTLNPGQGQTIRLRVGAGPADQAPAEYRSHLTIATLPPRDTGTTAEAAAAQTAASGLSINITALFGLSVPTIVRLNDLDVRASLENPRLTFEALGGTPKAPGPKVPVLTLDLVRLGGSSLFGSLDVRVQGQKGAPIGIVHGLGVYPEIERRTVQVVLTRPPAPGEKLEVTFTDDDNSPGKLLAKLAL